MITLSWTLKKFNELSPHELYNIMRLRSEVFVVEQNCVYLDADGKDQDSWHLYGTEGADIAGYVRILPAGLAFAEASIGRVLTNPVFRGKGLGRPLMEEAIRQTHALTGAKSIRIGAQQYLLKFYNELGFRQDSDTYMEDGIPHIEMLLSK